MANERPDLDFFASDDYKPVDPSSWGSEQIRLLSRYALQLEAENREQAERIEALEAQVRQHKYGHDSWKAAAIRRGDEIKRLREALQPFADYHNWRTAKGIKTHAPALGPKECAAAAAALSPPPLESNDG